MTSNKRYNNFIHRRKEEKEKLICNDMTSDKTGSLNFKKKLYI